MAILPKTIIGTTIGIVLTALAISAQAETKIYNVSMIEANYNDYMELLDGRDPMEIEDRGAFAPTRMTLEPFIFQIAPILGGCDCKIEVHPYTVDTPHARTLEQIRRGVEISHPIAGFESDPRYDENIILSEPILTSEEFFVGLYVHEDRKDLLALTNPDDIHALRYVVSEHWEVDKSVINHYGFNMVTGQSWNEIIQFLVAERGDVILQPFTAEADMSFTDTVIDAKFVPIPNVKLAFPFGRYYTVSRKFEGSEDFVEALNKGIKMLRDDGTLYRANIHAGITNPKIEDFTELFKEP